MHIPSVGLGKRRRHHKLSLLVIFGLHEFMRVIARVLNARLFGVKVLSFSVGQQGHQLIGFVLLDRRQGPTERLQLAQRARVQVQGTRRFQRRHDRLGQGQFLAQQCGRFLKDGGFQAFQRSPQFLQDLQSHMVVATHVLVHVRPSHGHGVRMQAHPRGSGTSRGKGPTVRQLQGTCRQGHHTQNKITSSPHLHYSEWQ
jgi:hypothetical protein